MSSDGVLPATKPLGSHATQVIALVNRMRDIGAHIVFDLPTIVFCGKQSAGKSSLIEAMSGVLLPRADGTCTRTPAELRLTNTGPDSKWQCHIKLRWMWDDNRNRERSPEEFKEELFEENIFDKSKVESVVRKAQLALLNPSGRAGGRNELSFSRNVICIDIRGPDVGNLSVIDLPGLIQTVEKSEEERNIELISNLVMYYIKNENSVVTMAISCKDDMENQAIKLLASKVDPKGLRTVGVLTKPDTIEEGTHDRFLDILNGKKYKLRLGYYAVKNPSQRQLNDGITHKQARKDEGLFFQRTYPWNQAAQWNRFGCSNLASKLGELLAERIDEQIPKMRDVILTDLSRTKDRIKDFPQIVDPNVAQTELLDMVCKLVDFVNDHVEANDGAPKELFREVTKLYNRFWKIIREKRPKFAVRPDKNLKDRVKDAVGIGSDDEESKGFEEDEPMIVSVSENGHNVEEVKTLIDNERGRRLPGSASYEPTRKLVREVVEQWNNPAQQLVSLVRERFQDTISELVNDVFGQFNILHRVVSGILQDLLDTLEEETRDNVKHILNMELDSPFTQNSKYLQRNKKRYVLELSHCVAKSGDEKLNDKDFLKKLKELAKSQGIDEDLLIKQVTQPETDEDLDEVINVMAGVMAYFKVSFKRFGDTVPMTIDRLLLRKFATAMRETMIEGLRLFQSEQSELAKLFHEDPHIVQTRKSLVEREKQLQRIWKELAPYAKKSRLSKWGKEKGQKVDDDFSRHEEKERGEVSTQDVLSQRVEINGADAHQNDIPNLEKQLPRKQKPKKRPSKVKKKEVSPSIENNETDELEDELNGFPPKQQRPPRTNARPNPRTARTSRTKNPPAPSDLEKAVAREAGKQAYKATIWKCESCTYDNRPEHLSCGVCKAKRPTDDIKKAVDKGVAAGALAQDVGLLPGKKGKEGKGLWGDSLFGPDDSSDLFPKPKSDKKGGWLR